MGKYYFESGDTEYVAANDNTTVIGTGAADEQIILQAGVEGVVADSTIERVDFIGDIADFQFQQGFGSNINILDGDGNLIASLASVDGKTLAFADGSVALGYTDGTVSVGGTDITTTAAAVVPATIDDTVASEADQGTVEPEFPEFSVSTTDVSEGEIATFIVTLSDEQTVETSVVYTVSLEGDTSAADHGDITVDGTVDNTGSGMLTFAAGETSKTIEIPVTEDTVSPEDGEGITVTLSSPEGADAELGAAAAATADITDLVVAFELTADEDTFLGEDADELIIGTTDNLSADDRLMDASITDNDTFNLTATADPAIMDVTNVENINIKWDAFGTPDIDLDDVSGGATVTLSSNKSGYLGSANFMNVGENGIVLSDGITGDVNIGGADDSTIDAGLAGTVVVGDGGGAGTSTEDADGEINLTADSSTSVTVNGADELVLSATSATTVDAGASNTANITFGKDADVTLDTANADVTLQSTDDVHLDLAGGNTSFDTLTIDGDNDITLDFIDSTDAVGAEITNAGTVILADDLTVGTYDFTTVDADNIVFESAQTTVKMTTVSGQDFTVEEDFASAFVFQTDAAEDTDADEITVTVEKDQAAKLDFATAGTKDFETVNIIADATVDAAAVDLTLADVDAGTNNVVLSAAENDVKVTAATAAELDASAVAGDFELTNQSGSAEMMVIGGMAENDVTFNATTNDSTFVGNETSDAKDTVAFDTTTGDATAIVYGGTNLVTAAALTTGQLTVVGGAGKDTVTATGTSITTGTLSLDLGNGDNSVDFDLAAGSTAGVVSITAGTGDDTVTINSNTEAEDEITMDLGTGLNTLDLSGSVDISLGTQDISGVDVIDIGSASTSAVVNASLLDEATVSVKGDGTSTDQLSVSLTDVTDLDVDFSSVSIDNSIDYALGGLAITAKTGEDNTILGSDGDDTITLTGAVDDVVKLATDAGTDKIDGYNNAGTDALDITSFFGDLVGTADFAEAAAGDKELSDAKIIMATTDGSTSDTVAKDLVAMNTDIDTTGDVTGTTLILVEAFTGNTNVYLYEDDENNAAIETGEVTKIGVLDTYNADSGDFTIDDFVIA